MVIIVLVAFIIAAVAEGSLFSFGVFFNPLLTEFGWTRAVTSGAISLLGIMHIPLIFIAGRLTDRLDSRWILSVCGFSLGLGYLLMSQVSALWHLYLFYGVLIAVAMAFYWVPIISIVPRWFVKRRALMMGIVTSGIGVGQLIYPPVVNWLISTHGWRMSFLIVGSVSMGIIMIAAQFIRRNPKQMGFLPYGSEPEQVAEARGFALPQAIRTKQFWTVIAIFFPWCFCLSIVLVHSVIYAIGLGMSPASAANILAIIGITGIVGRLAFSRLADVIGMKPVLIFSFVLMLAAFLCLLVDAEMWMVYLFSALYGMSYGTVEVLQSPIIANLFGLKSLGTITGAAMAIAAIGLALGPAIAGYIFDVSNSYQVAFLICATMVVIAAIFSALLPLSRGKAL